jgi:hypothetical protein
MPRKPVNPRPGTGAFMAFKRAPLTNSLPHSFFPSSKDGSRIVFAPDRDGNFELYQIYN